jgi:hypothetical protein
MSRSSSPSTTGNASAAPAETPICTISSAETSALCVVNVEHVKQVSVFVPAGSQDVTVTASPTIVAAFSVITMNANNGTRTALHSSVSCGELDDSHNGEQWFIGCFETSTYAISDLVLAKSELLTNRSCMGHPESGSCRESTYSVHLSLVTNYSDILQAQVASSFGQNTTGFVAPVKLIVSLGSKVEQVTVPIYFNFSNAAVDRLLRDGAAPSTIPSTLKIKHYRDTNSSNMISQSIIILKGLYDRIKWSVSA